MLNNFLKFANLKFLILVMKKLFKKNIVSRDGKNNAP